MARGIERSGIFRDDHDGEESVKRLSTLATSGGLMVYGWSLLLNHFHVLVRYLGQSGRALAQELGVRSQAVYAAAGRGGQDIEIAPVDLKRWCR